MKSRSIWLGTIVRALVAILPASAGLGLMLSRPSATLAAPGSKTANAASGYAPVESIFRAECASCHNPMGGAPFNLLTYADAKQWGGQILDVTQSRYMPPWLPAPGKGDFAGARRLSDGELAAIRTWVGAGMPAGNAPQSVAEPPEPEWQLGKPDAVLSLAEPVALPGNGVDVFTNLIVPLAGNETHRLRAMQIRPSDPQAVRSVWLTFDSGELQRIDGWKQGIAGMERPQNVRPGSAGLIFWSPGSQALRPHPGESWIAKPGGDLLLTTHLKTTGKKLDLQFQIALYFETHPETYPVADEAHTTVLQLKHRGAMEIPAGASATEFEDRYTLPQAAAVTAIYPRAHFLAHTFDAYATTPAGKQVWLLSIPKWDVDWLEVYVYRHPVLLPKGSVIHWIVSYDNSAENPHNPSDPPAAVRGGWDAKDEADALFLEVFPPAGVKADAWREELERLEQ